MIFGKKFKIVRTESGCKASLEYNKLNVNGEILTELEENEEEERRRRERKVIRCRRTISERSSKKYEYGKEYRINKLLRKITYTHRSTKDGERH